jgi:hypothetical protein
MEDINEDDVSERHKTVTEETIADIKNLEIQIKNTVKTLVMDQWDLDNAEIIGQLTLLAGKHEALKENIVKSDIEIFKLRCLFSDKRKQLKNKRIQLEVLKKSIQHNENVLV